MQHFTVYIDEAGDEGIGRLAAGPVGGQSRWLALGCCIVARENDLKLPLWRDEILSRFPKRQTRDLHFRNLKHDQKVVVCQEIAKKPIGVAITLSNKATIPGSKWESTFKQKGYLYNFLIRWLLERVTMVCRKRSGEEECSLKVVFSRRGGTNYQTMMEYFKLMRDGNEVMRPARRIDWSMIDIDQIAVENHSKWAGLQFADCVTSAYYSAVEPNAYGNYEHSYAELLGGRLLRSNGTPLNCGLTVVPSRRSSALDGRQAQFFTSFEKN